MKSHLKRPIAPKSWNILRKTNKFVIRPRPGAHKFEHGIPLTVFFRDMTKIAKNSKEVKYILTKSEVLVDGKRRRDPKHIVGLMDTLSLPMSSEYFRIIINEDGKISTVKIDAKEASTKACKITGKRMLGKKIQITLHDGRNMLADSKDYNTGDTLTIEVPSQKVLEHLKLDSKMTVYLVGGKHAGSTGIVESVSHNKIAYKTNSGEAFETLKEYAFVIGKAKPVITLHNE